MKIFRFFVINVILLFLIVTIISLFIPSHVRISRAINMQAPAKRVLQQLDDIEKWKNWYPGFDTMKMEQPEWQNGKLNAVNIPGTSVLITARKENEVVAEFRARGKYPVTSGWKTITYSHTDSLTVQWYFDFRLRWYPWEKFTSLLYEKSYGLSMEQGLQNLKKSVER